MGDGVPFLEIIFLAMVAGFLALRLISVLGRKTGHERRPEEVMGGRRPQGDQDGTAEQPGRKGSTIDDLIGADTKPRVDDSTPLGATLNRIMLADRQFDPENFVHGASSAYQVILKAFAEGDRDTLRGLLSDDVYAGFDAAISAREAASETNETRIVDVSSVDITDAELEDGTAEVTVTFTTDMVNVTRDAEGRVIRGNPHDADRVVDIWTFARRVKAKDPNWLLVGTDSADTASA